MRDRDRIDRSPEDMPSWATACTRRGFLKGLGAMALLAVAGADRLAHAAAKGPGKARPDSRVAAGSRFEDLCSRHERTPIGITFTFSIAHAPFPSPGSPYRDSTVLVFVPDQFRAGRTVDLIVHFHGHSTTAADAVKAHQLREQLSESCQNAILVAPQGPVRAVDSSGGRLEGKGGLRAMLSDVLRALGHPEARRLLGASAFRARSGIGRVAVSAHSGGYKVTARCLEHGGVPVSEVYLFDALYSEAAAYRDWLVGGRARKLVSYYTGGTTEHENKVLMGMLKKERIRFAQESREGTLTPRQLVRARAVFIRTDLSHQGVTHSLSSFRDCLLASNFHRRGQGCSTRWYVDPNRPRPLHKR